MKLFIRLATVALTVTILSAPAGPAAAAGPAADQRVPACSVVWFDLGDTLIDTSDRDHLTYMPGALRYLRQLHHTGVPVGIITNVPPSWGTTDAERAKATKNYIAASWSEPEPFVWEYFGDRILTPRSTEEYKPAPALFRRGIEKSGGCRAVFEGENPDEVTAASAAGMRGYQIGRTGQPAYLPLHRVLLPFLDD
ncbi:hypothetical protein EF912_01060 [Streptomyces sp. WAC07061]|uniref:hypothetical protein n=1 Tax=Streptomyces sp. WAC07061 TaxID=2487410 RepID=UPI000F76C6C6|nr:hypothetical protein [Streptomyces sp. WAC07061]RSS64861.1 hypothetical protein EF912_01060 [Streptomyces sp. WAC07061]